MEGRTVVLHNTVQFRHPSGRTKDHQYNLRQDSILYLLVHIYKIITILLAKQ
jgi:hypothetical protein